MQNRDVVIPSVPIRLNGRDYTAVLNWNAYAVFERANGIRLPPSTATRRVVDCMPPSSRADARDGTR